MSFKFLQAAVTAAFSAGFLSNPAAAQQLREFSYALPSRSLVAAAPRIAAELGLFEAHGLKPDFVYIDTTSGTATALLSQSVDIAETGVTEVITAQARGQGLLVVASHYSGVPGSLVLAKSVVDELDTAPDAPLEERLKALDGLLLAGVAATSNMTVAYRGAARAAGAEPEFTYMAVSAMQAALETGAVQGIITTAPFWAFPVHSGTGVLWISPPAGDVLTGFIPSSGAITATTPQFVNANPELVQDISAVFADLSAAVGERPDEVKAVVAQLYADLDDEILDLIWGLESRAFQTGPLTAEDIVRDIEFMNMTGADFGDIGSVDPTAVLLAR